MCVCGRSESNFCLLLVAVSPLFSSATSVAPCTIEDVWRSLVVHINAISGSAGLLQLMFRQHDCVSGFQSAVQEEEDSGGF